MNRMFRTLAALLTVTLLLPVGMAFEPLMASGSVVQDPASSVDNHTGLPGLGTLDGWVDIHGDTMSGDLAFETGKGIAYPGGRLVADTSLQFAGNAVCLANLPISGCGGGDITAVFAGFGLSGGGLSGDVTLAVNSALVQNRVGGVCVPGFSIRAIAQDGSVTCEQDDDTTYGAGAGLALAGTVFSIPSGGVTSAMVLDGTIVAADVDATSIQRRVTGSCAAGSYVRVIAQDGTVTCGVDAGLTYTAGAGLELSGTTFRVRDCTTDQVLRSGGAGVWNCASPASTNVASALVARDASGNFAAGTITAALNGNAATATAFPSNPADCIPGTVATGITATGIGEGCVKVWFLGGNSATVPGTDFVGTTDNQALEFKVNNQRALRIEPSALSPNILAGYSGNWLASGVYGATVAGGGAEGATNRVTDMYGVVGGGYGNAAGDGAGTATDRPYATVGGGLTNNATGFASTISGGTTNRATGSSATIGGGSGNGAGALHATVGGGFNNNASGGSSTISGGDTNQAKGTAATIGGGSGNEAGETLATVGGGLYNNASGYAATIAGGRENVASWDRATVGGGFNNNAGGYAGTIAGGAENVVSFSYATVAGGNFNGASGSYSMVPGGLQNNASGTYSFAAGRHAKANHAGSFVWSDSSSTDFASTAVDQFRVRARGGMELVGTSTRGNLKVSPDNTINADSDLFWSETSTAICGMNMTYLGATSNNLVLRGTCNSPVDRLVVTRDSSTIIMGVGRTPTANHFEVEGQASKTVSGSWLANSDARIKRDVQGLRDPLATLEQLRPVAFRYTPEYMEAHPSIREMDYYNFIAQEYAQVFPDYVQDSGEGGILQIDTYPAQVYAIAAIQQLSSQLQQKEREVRTLEERLAAIEARLGMSSAPLPAPAAYEPKAPAPVTAMALKPVAWQGEGRLVDGVAEVRFPAAFARSLSSAAPIRVDLVPLDAPAALLMESSDREHVVVFGPPGSGGSFRVVVQGMTQVVAAP